MNNSERRPDNEINSAWMAGWVAGRRVAARECARQLRELVKKMEQDGTLPRSGPEPLTGEQKAHLDESVEVLNPSPRARRAFAELGLVTIGGLVQKTPDDLLASKNFGATSLGEVRDKLAGLGLRLKND